MVVDIQGPHYLEDSGNMAENDEAMTLEKMEIRHYDNLVNDISKKVLPLAGRNKYMLIKFPTNEIPNITLTTMYEIQLLGYIPVISNAENNTVFRRNPNKLYALVAKGTLVQIDASSLTGENGNLLWKFVVKLCRHNLVHFVSSSARYLAITPPISMKFKKYLQENDSRDYLNYLQDNAKHVRKGSDFHIRMPIKFK